MTNEMFLGTLPATVTVLAIIRLRVCLCKGNATKLVSKRFVVVLYTFAVLGSVFLWALLQYPEFFVDGKKILEKLPNKTLENSFISLDTCYQHIHNIHSSLVFYKSANIFLCYISPVIVGICIYIKIIIHVYQSANRVQMHSIMPNAPTSLSLIRTLQPTLERNSSTRLSNGNRNASNIHRSVLCIIAGIIVSWVPICLVKVGSLIENEHVSCLYRVELQLVLVIFVTFPFEEGIFQSEKRKRICSLFKCFLGSKHSQNSFHGQVRRDVILIPESETVMSTLITTLQKSTETATEEMGRIQNVTTSKLSQHSMTSENCHRTSIQSFDSSVSSSLYFRRRGLMVPSLSLSTKSASESSSVFIISTPLSVDEHSPYLSSSGSFSPLFIKVNRGLASADSLNVNEPFNCTPYSIRTYSFGSTLSYDCQNSVGSAGSTSRTLSKWRSFQRKNSSSMKYSVSDLSKE